MPDWKMSDWKNLVREQLKACGLPVESCEDVVAELAAHLEETCDNARSQGLKEQEAIARTLHEVNDWGVLAVNIQRAQFEDNRMNHRTKSFWLPTLVTCSGASVSLLLLQLIGIEPRLIWIDLRHVLPASSALYGKVGMTFYWPWLASLPLFGALGACLSRHSQGNTFARLLTGLSPALTMLIVMCMILPFSLAIDGLTLSRLVVFGLWGVINWVAIPAMALLMGILPCLDGSVTAKPYA
jgi:hypothetical protein